jgi:hypothetical protein
MPEMQNFTSSPSILQINIQFRKDVTKPMAIELNTPHYFETIILMSYVLEFKLSYVPNETAQSISIIPDGTLCPYQRI